MWSVRLVFRRVTRRFIGRLTLTLETLCTRLCSSSRIVTFWHRGAFPISYVFKAKDMPIGEHRRFKCRPSGRTGDSIARNTTSVSACGGHFSKSRRDRIVKRVRLCRPPIGFMKTPLHRNPPQTCSVCWRADTRVKADVGGNVLFAADRFI